jgi:hypothetical protein
VTISQTTKVVIANDMAAGKNCTFASQAAKAGSSMPKSTNNAVISAKITTETTIRDTLKTEAIPITIADNVNRAKHR